MPAPGTSKHLLPGHVMRWVTWDAKHFVTAATKTMVDAWRPDNRGQLSTQLICSETLAELREVVACTEVSLILWTCYRSTDMQPAATSIRDIATRWPNCRRVCFLSSNLDEQSAIFVEAGAQIVVSQLPSLQRLLPTILESAPLFRQGFHPLSTGLFERLP